MNDSHFNEAFRADFLRKIKGLTCPAWEAIRNCRKDKEVIIKPKDNEM